MKLSKLFPLVLLGLTPVFAACSDQASANGAVAANADVASANASMAGMQSELVMEFAEKDLGNVFQQHSYDLEFPF